MLTVSSKGDYGLILLAGLAEVGARTHFVPLRSVARSKRLSYAYLAQLAVELKRAGYLDSKEGVGGGYVLTKDPKEIRVGDVVRLLEGSVTLTRCTDEGHLAPCPIEHVCTMRPRWFDLKHEVLKVMNRYTLADLIRSPARRLEHV